MPSQHRPTDQIVSVFYWKIVWLINHDAWNRRKLVQIDNKYESVSGH